LAERIEEDHTAIWASFPNFDPKNFDQPIPPPPIILYSLEEALERYKLLADQTPIPKATRGLHPITQKLVAEDERLAKLATPLRDSEPASALHGRNIATSSACRALKSVACWRPIR
jgi:hypothetical protein